VSERSEQIAAALRDRLAPHYVAVEDESHLHAGHVGAASGGGHYRATIVSEKFVGLSRVAAQRVVYDVLREELAGEIHALALRCLTPEQWEAEAG
jgi:BolA protein